MRLIMGEGITEKELPNEKGVGPELFRIMKKTMHWRCIVRHPLFLKWAIP